MRLPLLILHILAGTVGLLSGTFAIAVRKGSRLHRASGNIFTVAMLTLACSALCLAIMKSQHGNIIGSFITFYMIATAWLAGRRSLPEETRNYVDDGDIHCCNTKPELEYVFVK